jgi:diguanylate cyclase (GGDEF)-like protein
MADLAVGVTPVLRTSTQKLLAGAMLAVFVIHALFLAIPGPHLVTISRLCTAAVPLLAAAALLWRANLLPSRERMPSRWIAAALVLWAAGQAIEAFLPGAVSASNLSVDASDFLYLVAAFPLLLAISSTNETEPVRAIFYLHLAQLALAAALTYVRLFQTPMGSGGMFQLYAGECILLAAAALLRLSIWSTQEERRRLRSLCAAVWLYLPVEISLDYAASRWHLRSGTGLDLLWSLPFLFAGAAALYLPIETEPQEPPYPRPSRDLLVEALCPMLVASGIFALAASIAGFHPALAMTAIFLLLLSQGGHAALVQLNFLLGQTLLLEREQELEEANAGLEKLSRLDPLTGIYNRRHFNVCLDEAWRVAFRRQQSIGILMIDVDHFKGVNDLHGHTYGDQCLTTIARLLSRSGGRANDLLARYGGEEFVLLLPETDVGGAVAVAERMHQAIQIAGLTNNASPFNGRITVSIGVGVCSPRGSLGASILVEMADQALYEAKRSGRNKICLRTA